ncbi:MAG: fibronectin type III domain-containing protein [Thermoguttaceae bacterium]
MSWLNRLFNVSSPKSPTITQRIRKRSLALEPLESRELLAVSVAEFNAIKTANPELNLSGNMSDYNIIEVNLAQLSADSLQRAINEAGKTVKDDLIVLRTNSEHNSLLLRQSLSVDIDPDQFGSLTLVASSFVEESIPLTLIKDSGTALSILSGDVAIAGFVFSGQDALFNSSYDFPAILSVAGNATLRATHLGLTWESDRFNFEYSYVSTADPSELAGSLSQTPELTYTIPVTWNAPLVVSSSPTSFISQRQYRTGEDLYLNVAYANQGDVRADSFTVEVYIDGMLYQTYNGMSLNAWESNALCNIPLGSLKSGEHQIQVVLDSGHALKERNESNNLVEVTVIVADSVSTSSTISSTSPIPNPNNTFNIEAQIMTAGYVVVPGQNQVLYYDDLYTVAPDPIYLMLIQQACARWEEIITEGLASVYYTPLGRTIDDTLIFFGFSSLGDNGVLGYSSSLQYRRDNGRGLPATGSIVYNSDYYPPSPNADTQQQFYDTVLHEIGHALGYNTTQWELSGVLYATQTNPYPGVLNPYNPPSWYKGYLAYTGQNAARELYAIMGQGSPFCTPNSFMLETISSPGSYGSHISSVYGTYFEFIKQHELMNWQAAEKGISVQLSSVTIGVLEDIGYTVDYAMSDPFGTVAPKNLHVTSSSKSQISLAWELPETTNVTNVQKRFTIERLDTSSPGSGWVKVTTDCATLSYTDTTVVADKQYEYRVSVTNLVTPRIAGVGLVEANAALSWNALQGATRYYIDDLVRNDLYALYGMDNLLMWDGAGTTTSTSYTNNRSLALYYRARADQAIQAVSQPSKGVRETAEDRLGTPVIAFVQTLSDTAIQLEWSPISGAGRYEIQYSPYNDFRAGSTRSVYSSSALATITGLQSETTYYFRVKATGSATMEDSRWSGTRNAKTMIQAPQGLRVTTATSETLSLSWRGVAGAAFYYIEYGEVNAEEPELGWYTMSLTNSVTLTDLSVNTEYHVKVQAFFWTGENTAWAEIDAWTLKWSLAAPQIQVVGTTQNSTILSWNDFGNRVSGYKVQYSTDEMFAPSKTETVDTKLTRLEVTQLTSNVLYYFRVEAVGEGDYTDSIYSPSVKNLTMRSLHALDDPTLENPQLSGLTVTLNWNEIIGQSGTEEYKAGFIVECSTSSGFVKDKTRVSGVILGTTCQIEGLSPDTTYYFRVHAVGNKQFRDSNFSIIQSVRTGPGTFPPFSNLYDLTGNGRVGSADFLVFAKSFGKREGEDEKGYNELCDFNKDGKVNAADFLLFAKAFGKTTEELESISNAAKPNNALFVVPVADEESVVASTGGIATVASLSPPAIPVIPTLTENSLATPLLTENSFAGKETVGLTGRESQLAVSVDSLEERILDRLFTEDDFGRTMNGLHFEVGSFELLEDSLVVRL